MHTKKISLLAVAALLLCSFCTSQELIKPAQEKIDAYLAAHPDLPVTDKDCVEDGRFEMGMLTETLLFLLGEPKLKETVTQPWAKQEKWTYKRKGEKVFIIEGNHVVGILENN